MAAHKLLVYIAIVATTLSIAYATDPTQLQDFCVAANDTTNALFINGLYCKNPLDATPEDFFFSGIDKAGDTSNPFGSDSTVVSAANLPGLNTLGISIVRLDFLPNGIIVPHSHNRASEVLIVMEGTIYVGFVNSQNKLFDKVLNKGDVFVFPQGLIHFHLNVGKTPAVAFSALSSQDPGLTLVANALFGSLPAIPVNVLSQSFQLSDKIVKNLQSTFTPRS